jgi:sentrin-specific protease 1
MIVGFCLARMESQEKNIVLPIPQGDNTLPIDEYLLVCLSHNKPKKSVSTAIVSKGIISSIALYGSICIFFGCK